MPRPRLLAPASLLRRAPVIDRLARRRARERLLFAPTLALEIIAAIGVTGALVGIARGAALPHLAGLRRALSLDAGLEWAASFGLAPASVTFCAAAAILLWWIIGVSAPASR
ncbi:MAG: hypothetical protein R3B09_30800 [Nannocystaceae bacterium]